MGLVCVCWMLLLCLTQAVSGFFLILNIDRISLNLERRFFCETLLFVSLRISLKCTVTTVVNGQLCCEVFGVFFWVCTNHLLASIATCVWWW